VIAIQVTPTNVPPAALPAKPSVIPDFRLNGIIYTVGRPSAILNGKTVYVGDRINGAIVLRIGQTDVTLQVNGKRWTYDLP
jgi:MSHA biogenesis protein MshK